MDITLDDEFVTSRDDGFHRFLVKWHGHPNSLLDCYLSFHSSKSSSFQPRGNDGHGVGPYLGLNEIGSPSPMMNLITINYLFNCIFGFIYYDFWIYLLSIRIFGIIH